MAAISSNLASSLLKFTFTDGDGEIVASFRMNPADVKLAQRLQEMQSYFDEMEKSTPENATLDDVIRFNDELEEKICKLLGYDARQALFGFVSATSIMEDGNMFIVHVMNVIQEHVFPEIRKRQQSMAEAIAKHTAKYTK